jgi:predicted site-specific integrase-resolvase
MRTVTTEIIERYEKTEKPEQFLSRKQTAKMLDVDLSTLWRWDKEQYLLTIAIGGKRRYKLSDVERILKLR